MPTRVTDRLALGNSASRVARATCALGVLVTAAGCNSFDAPIPDSQGAHLVIPTDTRPAYRAQRMPPAISGGTLLVTRNGQLAVASDAERDAIVVADLTSTTIRGTIALEPGDEPGRLVEGDQGRVYVALRRGGAVVTIDPATLTLLERRPVCGAPRGLALSTPSTLEVACADGKLVTLPTAGGAATRVLELGPDLRDVVVTPAGLRVSRFKAAEVLALDPAGAIARHDRLPLVEGTHSVVDRSQPTDDPSFVSTLSVTDPFRPAVAWRSLAGPNGSTVVVHQRALEAEVEITPPSMNGSAYGSGFSCSGIAQNAISVVGKNGAVTSATFSGPPLPVDATLMPDGRTLLVAHAGPADLNRPQSFVVFDGDEEGVTGGFAGGAFGLSTLSMIVLPDASDGTPSAEASVDLDPGCSSSDFIDISDPVVAVAYNPTRPEQVVALTVQPSQFVVFDNVWSSGLNRTISFDDGSTLDTGFQLFHRDSGAGVACATCHAEGAEDGHVWRFEGFGERRTQALNVGLEGTAPFHWDGKLQSVGALMSEVFVGRMGGIHESDARMASFQGWLFGLKPPAPLRAVDEEAVVRGKSVFRTSGCGSCHSGAHFTNNASVFVGTASAVPLQVPSLIGIGYRAPFLHNGCAKTLAARFAPACGGGDRHGITSDLTAPDISDLVAYLESL